MKALFPAMVAISLAAAACGAPRTADEENGALESVPAAASTEVGSTTTGPPLSDDSAAPATSTTIDVERPKADFGSWDEFESIPERVVEAALARPFTAEVELTDDDWLLPSTLPDGVSLRYVDVQGRSVYAGRSDRVGEALQMTIAPGIGLSEGDVHTFGGREWLTAVDSDQVLATLPLAEQNVLVVADRLAITDVSEFIEGLGVVATADLPITPAGPGVSTELVARFETANGTTTLAVAGGPQAYSAEIVTPDGDGSWSGATWFDISNGLSAVGGGGSMEDAFDVYSTSYAGFAHSSIARVEVEFIDGQVVTSQVQDLSGGHEIRFWVIQADVAIDSDGVGEPMVELRGLDPDGEVLAIWDPTAPYDEEEREAIPEPVNPRPPSDLVIDRRAPTIAEQDRLDDDGAGQVLDCELAGAATWDYGPIGPDSVTGRVSDDALLDLWRDMPTFPAPKTGWTELIFRDESSTFVHSIENADWRYIVNVGGDPELGVRRLFELQACDF